MPQKASQRLGCNGGNDLDRDSRRYRRVYSAAGSADPEAAAINNDIGISFMKRFRLAPFAALLLAPLCSFAADPLFVQIPALIDPTAPVPNAVRTQCDVDKMLADDVLAAINDDYGPAQSIPSVAAGSGRVVRLTITEVYGLGGGAWSGGKYMSARAELLQDGKQIDYVNLKRTSGGGILGGVTGTCGILDRIGRALGKDTVRWLKNLDRNPASAHTDQPT
jgi:hypothetical protein